MIFFLNEKKPLSCSDLLPSVLCSQAEELHNSPAYYWESKACAGNAGNTGMEWICSDPIPASPKTQQGDVFIVNFGEFLPSRFIPAFLAAPAGESWWLCRAGEAAGGREGGRIPGDISRLQGWRKHWPGFSR